MSPMEPQDSIPPQNLSSFVSTHWTLVQAAADSSNAGAKRALEKLCQVYWPPLYAYALRRAVDQHEAQDWTQAFFATLLEKEFVAQADRNKGRFRAFLITAFKNFLGKEWEKKRAQKRGGNRSRISFDFAVQHDAPCPLADYDSPERVYERQWALTLLNRVMDFLKREMERNGNGLLFHHLKDFIGGDSGQSFAAIASKLDLSEPAARMAASRMRKRYRELIRFEVAQTVGSGEEIDEEIQYLFSIFSS